MKIRPLVIKTDLPIVTEWWKRQNSPVLPTAAFLSAAGFVAENGNGPVAASWLYVVPGEQGGIGVIEFTVSDPYWSLFERVAAIKMLYAFLEQEAWTRGCGSVMSFVAVVGVEQRLMDKAGYKDVGGVPHLIYGKARPCP